MPAPPSPKLPASNSPPPTPEQPAPQGGGLSGCKAGKHSPRAFIPMAHTRKTLNAAGREWSDLDLTGSNLDRSILDRYTFGALLLEINCGIRDISPDAIRAHFEQQVTANAEEAREIFAANAESIYLHAIADRDSDGDGGEDDYGEPYGKGAQLRVIVGEGGQRTIVGAAGYLRAKREAAEEEQTLAPWSTLEVYPSE